MKTKTFEIRDRATFIPALAVKLRSDGNENDRYLLDRAGLDSDGSYQVMLFSLGVGYGFLDPFKWPDAPMVRTFHLAHQYLEKHFDDLETGSVIDVQFILGETDEPAKSEKYSGQFGDFE